MIENRNREINAKKNISIQDLYSVNSLPSTLLNKRKRNHYNTTHLRGLEFPPPTRAYNLKGGKSVIIYEVWGRYTVSR